MNNIILYSDKKDSKMKDVIINQLSQKYLLNIFELGTIHSIGKGQPLNIIHTNSLKNISIKDCVLIFCNGAKVSENRMAVSKNLDKSVHIIVDSENTKCICQLAKYVPNIYTCGFSQKDYITFSSREDDKAVVSLQRSIRINNKTISEPFEIPCNITCELSDYYILATVLTLIFLKEINEKKCSTITKIYL